MSIGGVMVVHRQKQTTVFTTEIRLPLRQIIQCGPKLATKTNNTMWTKTGTVTHSGNTFWGPDGTYNLSGDILHGPNGQIWTGVNSEDDAMSIIAHKLK